MTETRPIESVAIALYEGFDELDAIGPYEVLENAAEAGADLDVALATLEPADRVTASHGLVVEPDGSLDDLAGDPDLVVVPGGGWTDGAEHGARAEVERGALPDAVAERYRDGTAVASVCTGGMILAAAGVLDGRPATTHHGAIDDLRETAANVVDARVVDDGDVLTAGGVTSGLDLALWLVERELGADVVETVAREMEYERRGEVYRSD
ncbi:DJ-1/PfpI family protein [Halococcus agarilyticus]|uniref:DJ-1/PfpI family protein n=1 Tax=Halococcus agarilyticus TaxID=1232219 RepID=UPI000677A6CF|nr:DJ-1/PfpI family protein [Halococcus agarilyticus]